MSEPQLKKIKILYIANLNSDSGVACFLMNYIRHMDLNLFDISFITWDVREKNFHNELSRLGAKIYVITSYKKNPIRFLKDSKQIIQNQKFDIIHAHEAVMSIPFLWLGKRYGIPIRIAHSHNSLMSSTLKNEVVKLSHNFFKLYATHYWACSEIAGKFLFGEKIFSHGTVVPNAIEIDPFLYSETIRHEVRVELGIEGKFVVGHVGRFNEQKNHEFLIDIFKSIHDSMPNSILLLIGDGELKNEISEKVQSYGLTSSVKFLGVRDDVNKLLQAMDVFVFPSLYEGLGIALIEAQAAGLYCFTSKENVPVEAKITEQFQYISLSNSACEWAQKILHEFPYRHSNESLNLKIHGYEICLATKKLEARYLRLKMEAMNEKPN